MDRYTPQTPPSTQELALAKARLRVAAIQASPAELVRRHPWASVIGTFSASMAAGALAGSKQKSAPPPSRGKAAQSTGFGLPSGLMQWALGLGMQLIQAHMAQKTVQKSAENAATEEPNAVG